MQPEDIPRVMIVERASYRFPWSQQIFSDCLRVGYSCWKALEDQEIVGYVVMSVAVGECHILNLCVKPDRQRRGIGRRLLSHALELGRQRGAETAYLEVRQSNLTALGLYESLGFNQIGQRRDYYPADGGREDAVILACQLRIE